MLRELSGHTPRNSATFRCKSSPRQICPWLLSNLRYFGLSPRNCPIRGLIPSLQGTLIVEFREAVKLHVGIVEIAIILPVPSSFAILSAYKLNITSSTSSPSSEILILSSWVLESISWLLKSSISVLLCTDCKLQFSISGCVLRNCTFQDASFSCRRSVFKPAVVLRYSKRFLRRVASFWRESKRNPFRNGGTKRIPFRPARENGKIWPEAHDRKRAFMDLEG